MNIEQSNHVSFSVLSAGTEEAIDAELCTNFNQFTATFFSSLFPRFHRAPESLTLAKRAAPR